MFLNSKRTYPRVVVVVVVEVEFGLKQVAVGGLGVIRPDEDIIDRRFIFNSEPKVFASTSGEVA